VKPLFYFVVKDQDEHEGYVVACSTEHAKADAEVQGMTLTGGYENADHPADYCPQCGYDG
jgi:hypothetical protein